MNNKTHKTIKHALVFILLFITVRPGESASGTTCFLNISNAAVFEKVSTNELENNNNLDSWLMAVFKNYLYVGTWSQSSGIEIGRTSNGTDWEWVAKNGFEDANNVSVNLMAVFKGYLYTGTWNDSTGGEIWRTFNGTVWKQVNVDAFGITGTVGAWSMAADAHQLYAGTWNESSGTGLLNYPTDEGWNTLVDDGFGSSANKSIDSMAIFKGKPYAGLWNPSTGTEVWRYNIDYLKPKGSVKINGGARTLPQNENVTLNISANDKDGSGVVKMVVSNSSKFESASWEDYVTTKTWSLEAGVGKRSVFIKFKDMAGNVSMPAKDSIKVVN